MVRTLVLKNFQTSARIYLQQPALKPLFGSRSLTCSSNSFKLYNKEPTQSSTSEPHKPTIYSEGEVETAGPSIRV